MRVAVLLIAMGLAAQASLPVRAQALLPAPNEPYPVVLPPQTFQAIVNYLKRQPWEEAQPLMAALAQAAQASAPKPADRAQGLPGEKPADTAPPR
ncbi:MAG: hypothetical protein AB7F35_10205 [Acetobacteraceae bacterium]